jgi:peptidoglycan hydrolase-like protein with peptidoglycan-binding domain
MGPVEIFALIAILLSRAQKGFSPGAANDAAADAAKKAADAAAAAAAAAAAGDHNTAQQKSQEAQDHAAQSQALSQAARTPPPWPMVVPSDLPPFPSGGWKPASPVTSAMVSRAFQLLPTLWNFGAGTWKPEKTGPGWVVYQAVQMGPKRGVVAFTPVTAAVPSDVPSQTEEAATPAARNVPSQPVVTPGAALPTTPASTSAPSSRFVTLRRGSRGPSVVWVQQRLGIPADGDFGHGTQAAVIAFQQAHGLAADGVVGPNTWAALGGSAQAA